MKLPRDAAEYYLGLGVDRSYSAVAQHYRRTTRAVKYRAKRENWTLRAYQFDQKMREDAEKKAADSIEATREYILKIIRHIELRAIDSTRTKPIDKCGTEVSIIMKCFRARRDLIRGDDQEPIEIE